MHCNGLLHLGKTTNDIHVSLAPTNGDGDISHPRMDVYEVFLEYPKKIQNYPKIFYNLSPPPDSHRWVWKHKKRNSPRDAGPHSR